VPTLDNLVREIRQRLREPVEVRAGEFRNYSASARQMSYARRLNWSTSGLTTWCPHASSAATASR